MKGKPQNLLRQKNLAKILLEDAGKTPIGRLMIRAGYKKGYAKNPQELKKTLTWQELMKKFLPDELLSQRHQDLLNKQEFIAIGKKGEREVIATGVIDGFAVSKGLDMAYKLKGRYPKDQGEQQKVIVEIKNRG